jgi:hypothetical protein
MLIDKHIDEIMQIPGLTTKADLEYLCGTATRHGSWTEIGAYCGRSFFAVGLCLPQGALIQVIDSSLGTLQKANQTLLSTYVQLVQMRPDLRISMHRMQSRHCATAACDTEVVFIDGNHTKEHVAADIEIWSKKARLLLGHDYGYPEYPGVKQAVDEALASGKFTGFERTNTIWKLEVTCNA